MFASLWLRQLRSRLFGLRSRNRRRTPPAAVRWRVRPCLEPLEDRLAPSADAVQTVAGNISTPFSETQQSLTLTANVKDTTTPSTTVNEGTVTFTVKDSNGNQVGTPVQGTVSNGTASSSPFTLPSGEAAGNYTIDVSYSDSADNFSDGGDTSGALAVNTASTITTAANATAAFSSSDQDVTLTATVNSGAGTVSEGNVTFTILQGTTVIGTATSDAVSNGSASVSYVLPGGTDAGSYTIEASYSDSTGTGNFADSSDTSHTLTVTSSTAAATTTTASNATATFNSGTQNVTLSATVTSGAGTVNAGNVTFTILQGTTVIGTAVTSGTVSNGSASVSYALPAGTAAGSYTIEANYSDSAGNFAISSDTSHTLTISAASTTTTATSPSATFSSGTQNVTLTATVTSSAGTVNEGSVLFTLVDSNGNTIGTATSDKVSNGSASASYALPGGTAAGSYTIKANYSDSANNFANSSDNSHLLTVHAATTTITASNTMATFSESAQNVVLTAAVTSSAGTINEGSVLFTLVDSKGNTIGTAVSGNVSNGSASASYVLPGGTAAGSYTIEADYSDSTGNFTAGSDDSRTLTVGAATSTSLTLTSVNIVPNLNNSTAQVTLTVKVSSPAGSVNEGAVTFNLAGVSGQGNVVNGTASAQLAVPLIDVIDLNSVTSASFAYSDKTASASFADGSGSATLYLNITNAVLPANVTFDTDGKEGIQAYLASLPLFGFTYSSSGQLTEINSSSISWPVTYTNVDGDVLVSIAGVPWQVNFFNSNGQYQGIATLSISNGTGEWLFLNAAGQIVGENASS